MSNNAGARKGHATDSITYKHNVLETYYDNVRGPHSYRALRISPMSGSIMENISRFSTKDTI